jgi:hypothetical protein
MQAIVHERDRRRRDMATKRKVEVFSAGCPTCKESVETVKKRLARRAR